ncbi:MAG: hypothetical protein OXC44_01420 [Proteobacteria bacterium]|nr:hypothetical protein [Pseudomonadota bacterium]
MHLLNKDYIIKFVIVNFFWILTSCGALGFLDLSKQDSESKSRGGDDSQGELNPYSTRSSTETFDVTTESTSKKLPIKMLWLIDNSGSMKDDVLKVQKGIKGFVYALKENHGLDITVTIVSCYDKEPSREYFCLSSKDLNTSHSSIKKVDLHITSNDGLINAALLLSKKTLLAKAGLTKYSITSKNLQTSFLRKFITHEASENIAIDALKEVMDGGTFGDHSIKILNSDPTLISSQSDYFGNNQVNVIVSVTDENATLRADSFIKFLRINYGTAAFFRYFGFIDPSVTEHGIFHFISNDGIERLKNRKIIKTNSKPKYPIYENLAKKLGGKIFNIKQENAPYNKFFTDLSEEVKINNSINVFTLKEECIDVEQVQLDGSDLDTSLFFCSGNKINVNEKALENGRKITVKYLVAES